MLPTTPNGVPAAPLDPQLTTRVPTPSGVINPRLKMLAVFGFCAVLILATMVSSIRKKPAIAANNTKKATTAAAAPDNTANNVATLHAQLAAEEQKPPQAILSARASDGMSAQSAEFGSHGATGLPAPTAACIPGQPCAESGYVTAGQGIGEGSQSQLSPERQQAQQLAAKERERLYSSRFASNIAYSHSAQVDQVGQQGTNQAQILAASGQASNLIPTRAVV